MVFILAYGMASQSILYPNEKLDIYLVRDVLRKPYWQMYGELFLEELEGENVFMFRSPLLLSICVFKRMHTSYIDKVIDPVILPYCA